MPGLPPHPCERHLGGASCASCESSSSSVRVFETGATRDLDERKHDFEGFLSPLVLREFAAYMHEHRLQRDGSLRASDNWQRGMPLDAYMKSAWRHFVDWWSVHRGLGVEDFDGELVDVRATLCALLFNVQGYLHELLRRETLR